MESVARGVAAAVMAAAAGLPAAAQSGDQGRLPQQVADDFYVTVQEVRANSRATFESFGGAGGQPVSKQEFVTTDLAERIGPSGSNERLLGRLFDLLDADDSGKVTLAEWNQQIEQDLSFADGNGDGRISLKELSNARKNMGVGDALGLIF